MKLTVGLGSVDEYIRFSEAGADEFFCGYVPYSWTQKYDTMMQMCIRDRNRILVVPGSKYDLDPEDLTWLKESISSYDLLMLQLELRMDTIKARCV